MKQDNKTKIKILISGLSQNIGGIENWVYGLFNFLDKDKYEISFLIDKSLHIAYQDFYEKCGCKIFKAENRKKNYFQYLKDLKSIYKNNDFDVIHINMMGYSIWERITFACKYSNAKVIVHCHTDGYSKDCSYKKTMFLNKIGKFFVKKYDKKIIKVACSDKSFNFAFSGFSFVNNQNIIFNGIDVQKFKFSKEARRDIRKELGIHNQDFVIGCVAFFNDAKNHDFLIDVFDEFNKIKNAKLVLVGEGNLKCSIENKVKQLGLEDRVIFTGARLDIDKVLSCFDCYVMPSKYEGFSIALCEAQANGLVCFTSNRSNEVSNITGNLDFIDLNLGAKEWANIILSKIFSLQNFEYYRAEAVSSKFAKNYRQDYGYLQVKKLYDNCKV